ncbi:MAG: hypothetical protein FIA97_07000 [Methylococcaceae bacterium]|nr:hypothetical protein [Methylococcaceae bacterium]
MRTVYAFCPAVAACLLISAGALAAPPEGSEEITSLVSIKPPRARVIGNPSIYSQLKLSNRSKLTLQGPLGVLVHVVKPAGASLVGSQGNTGDGYQQLLAEGDELPPGSQGRYFTLMFDNPKSKPVKFQLTPYGKLPGPADPPLPGQVNVTGMVKVSLPRPRYNAKAQAYRSRLRVTNVSATTIETPLTLALASLLPEGTSLVGVEGKMTDGSPYLTVPLVNGSLPAGRKSPPLTLSFAAPPRTRIQTIPTMYGMLPVPGSDPLFTATNVWNQRIDSAPLHPDSAAMIAQLKAAGGWGAGNALRIDFSINVLEAGSGTPRSSITPAVDFYRPDCDDDLSIPMPEGGAVEGESGYECTQDGDCHLLVVARDEGKLYELYGASRKGGVLSAMCAVAWDLNRSYPAELRGDQCTSADAAGLPIAPLMFSADEIAAGSIDHAIRFILPNNRMRAKTYVRPATHAGAPSSTNALAIPYGSRLRLRADYPLDKLPSDGARVVARAMQRYGMILADGGNIALTARNDDFTSTKWTDVGFDDSYPLADLKVEDFEVIDTGPVIDLSYRCVRNGY